MIRWEDDGLEWEADQRHAELIVSQLDLGKANAVVTPGVKDESKPKSTKEQENEIIDFIQEMVYHDSLSPGVMDKLGSGVTEVMERQGWWQTREGSWMQRFRGARGCRCHMVCR